jgi:hypothetical protein
LQKSTGGARRFALDEVNLHRARSGLARSCASIGERRSVGSWIAAAKPRDQWRARTDHRASGLRACTRRWKSLWVVGTATARKRLSKCSRSPLTRGREGNDPWRRRCRLVRQRRRDREGQRCLPLNRTRGRKRRGTGAPPGAVLGSSNRGDREQQARSSMGVVKRTSTRGRFDTRATSVPRP